MSRRFPNLSRLDENDVIRVAAQCATLRHFFVPTEGSGWDPAFGKGVAFRCVCARDGTLPARRVRTINDT